MFQIAMHKPVLQSLGLTSLDAVRAFRGELVKDQRGRRDILRIDATDASGAPLRLYLKRIYKPYRKDGLHSLLRRGAVWSLSRIEWNNIQVLNRHGFTTAEPVAFGEEVGPFWERFSFIITAAAPAPETLLDFLKRRTSPMQRRRVIDALAGQVREMHEKGLASPDLFARHFFVEAEADPVRFYLIDMARLDHARRLGIQHRARDLAALHVSVPLRYCRITERLRFLKVYCGGKVIRMLAGAIAARSAKLLRRSKFRDFNPVVEGPRASAG